MNNTFDIKRFGLTFRKDLIENGKRYSLMFLTMLGLLALFLVFYSMSYYNSKQNLYLKDLLIFLSMFFFVAGVWFASTFTSPMSNKLNRIAWLISPASNLEKYLVRWIITTIGFILTFFTALWIADVLRVAICSAIYPEIDVHFIDLTKLVTTESEYSSEHVMPASVFFFFSSLYLLTQSVFLLGSTYWEKWSFIKTFSFCAAIIAAFILICRWTILLFYGEMEGFYRVMNSLEINQKMNEQQALVLVTVILSVFTLTFWTLAYFRIKESEIIKRL